MKDIIEKYVGAACEVKTLENDLLFLGKIRNVVDGLTLSLDVVSSDKSPLLSSRYGVPVKLSLYKNASNMLIVGGKVYMANPDFWRISNISQYQNYERRDFFRVQANTDTEVFRESEEGEEPTEKFSAHIINISLSGILFSAERKFVEGQVLLLSPVKLAEGLLPFELRCQVRNSDEESPAGFLHRCKFLDMGQRESDRLCRAIFAMQREAIRKRKSRI